MRLEALIRSVLGFLAIATTAVAAASNLTLTNTNLFTPSGIMEDNVAFGFQVTDPNTRTSATCSVTWDQVKGFAPMGWVPHSQK